MGMTAGWREEGNLWVTAAASECARRERAAYEWRGKYERREGGRRCAEPALYYTRDHVGGSHALYAHTHTKTHTHNQIEGNRQRVRRCRLVSVHEFSPLIEHKRPPPPPCWRFFFLSSNAILRLDDKLQVMLSSIQMFFYSHYCIFCYLPPWTPLTTADEHNTFDANCNDNDDNTVVRTQYSHTIQFTLLQVKTRTKHCETG